MTKYSVVIPTKNRPDTLVHTLRNVLATPRRDVEVVVHQCGEDDATSAAVASIRDDRVRFFTSAEALPMRENWERALAHARGEFVTVIGDDDGIVPGAFDLADTLLAQHRPRLLSWRPVTYYWPGYFNAALAGRAIYCRDATVGDIRFSSDYALRSLYRFRWHYSDMPMIYNSLVRGDLIDSIRAAHGRYFFLNSPDVTSGVVNASHCDEFVWSNYPLSITGISQNSTGHRLVMQDDAGVKEGARREFMPQRVEQPWIAPGSNLDFGIAAELLALAQTLGLGERGIRPRMKDVADYVARHLNQYAGQVPESLASLREFCERHAIDFDELAARFLLDAPRAPASGAPAPAEPPPLGMDHDLVQHGARDIEAAARWIAERLGPPRPAALSSVGFGAPLEAARDEPLVLRFCHTGNAVQCLDQGWNRPEAFGTWACDYRASLRLPVPPGAARDGRLRIEIAARGPIMHGEHRFFYAARIPRAHAAVCGEFGAQRLSGNDVLELDVSELAGEREFELVFRCVELVNGALLGIGADNRPLGVGLETITISLLGAREP